MVPVVYDWIRTYLNNIHFVKSSIFFGSIVLVLRIQESIYFTNISYLYQTLFFDDRNMTIFINLFYYYYTGYSTLAKGTFSFVIFSILIREICIFTLYQYAPYQNFLSKKIP